MDKLIEALEYLFGPEVNIKQLAYEIWESLIIPEDWDILIPTATCICDYDELPLFYVAGIEILDAAA